MLDRQCPFICQKVLNIDPRACTEDSKFESAGWYSCCLTGSVPGGHDINWDMNHCPLISVHDVSVFIGTCNWEQNLSHGVVWGSAGQDMLRADHGSCLSIMSVPVHALSSRQISSDLSRSANRLSLRVNSNYLGLKACTWVITMNNVEHWLLRMPEILSSPLVCCWSARHGSRPDSGSTDPWAAPVWKAVNPASWIRKLVCPLWNTSTAAEVWLHTVLRFLTICRAVHFQEKLSLRRPISCIWGLYWTKCCFT